jgi:hypothetical protein
MANDTTKTTEAPESTAPANDSGASPDLTVQDLATIRNIIDVASTRGAFKAGELESVGKIYNKLDLFLNSLAEQKGTSS